MVAVAALVVLLLVVVVEDVAVVEPTGPPVLVLVELEVPEVTGPVQEIS